MLFQGKKKIWFIVLSVLAFIIFGYIIFFRWSKATAKELDTNYYNLQSIRIEDRNGILIELFPNSKGYYSSYTSTIPKNFSKLLLRQEDKYFYFHPGWNPISLARGIFGELKGKRAGSSTITQQLVKILLDHESERTIKNKIRETMYALAMERELKKDEILLRYLNSIYLGSRIQGIKEASQFYFHVLPDELTEEQTLLLLILLRAPSKQDPIGTILSEDPYTRYHSETSFELSKEQKKKISRLSIDAKLTEEIRAMLSQTLLALSHKNVRHGALVVIAIPSNEVLAFVGSPTPNSEVNGYQINMATKPRAIGSTIKPFLYLKGFEKGLRPHTLVDDREYKYTTQEGFAFYPKNYDYEYHGRKTLWYALSNSLNIPSIKVLEFIGMDAFNRFLIDDLSLEPTQPIKNYELSIALGGLEASLLNLAHFYTIFPQGGILKPLSWYLNDPEKGKKRIVDENFVELVNKILEDRQTGVEQFGQKSHLNLFQNNYALKTGTSREFHDSWIIGYTPDFVVGVWIGNADNSPMDDVSGQNGAGALWSEVMELLFHSPYNHKTPFSYKNIQEVEVSGTLSYQLPHENPENFLNLLLEEKLILSPYDGDVILKEENTIIPLKAKKEVEWFINDVFFDRGEKIFWKPRETGKIQIIAKSPNGEVEKIELTLLLTE